MITEFFRNMIYVQAKSDNKNLGKMAKKIFQLGFSSEIKVPQLTSARLEPENSSSGSSLVFNL